MYKIENYMEPIVFKMMEEALKDMDMCQCERCRLDVAAIALNNLPPKYYVSSRGRLYTKIATLQQQFEVDVLSAITRAAILVKENPHHE